MDRTNGPPQPGLESTLDLLDRVRRGEEAAENALLERVYPRFRAWATGRIPDSLRGPEDTSDLMQKVLIRLRRNLATFDPARDGGLFAYLRRSFINQIRDAARRRARRPERTELGTEGGEQLPSSGPSPAEVVIGREVVDAYEEALAELEDEEREAIIMKVELDYDNAQIAVELRRPTEAAARMFVNRSLHKLARRLQRRLDHA